MSETTSNVTVRVFDEKEELRGSIAGEKKALKLGIKEQLSAALDGETKVAGQLIPEEIRNLAGAIGGMVYDVAYKNAKEKVKNRKRAYVEEVRELGFDAFVKGGEKCFACGATIPPKMLRAVREGNHYCLDCCVKDGVVPPVPDKDAPDEDEIDRRKNAALAEGKAKDDGEEEDAPAKFRTIDDGFLPENAKEGDRVAVKAKKGDGWNIGTVGKTTKRVVTVLLDGENKSRKFKRDELLASVE